MSILKQDWRRKGPREVRGGKQSLNGESWWLTTREGGSQGSGAHEAGVAAASLGAKPRKRVRRASGPRRGLNRWEGICSGSGRFDCRREQGWVADVPALRSRHWSEGCERALSDSSGWLVTAAWQEQRHTMLTELKADRDLKWVFFLLTLISSGITKQRERGKISDLYLLLSSLSIVAHYKSEIKWRLICVVYSAMVAHARLWYKS